MQEYNYKDAQKAAQKEYRLCVARGVSPCLPVLDDFVPPEKSASGTELGLIQIPAKWIVGTKTRGRVNAFAANFMPLLEDGTEFADKWKSLCSSHLNEGIREPIKVYEYMNRYYVEEGNKRVSVLKFFDAYSIPAYVIRVMPEYSEDEAVQRYLSFVKFNQVSKINVLEFSKAESYQSLLMALGKSDQASWTDEERKHFCAVYYRFEKAYESIGSDQNASTAGDAMLSYIDVYGYRQLSQESTDAIKRNLKKMTEELILEKEDNAIEVKADPSAEKKPTVLSKILPFTKTAPLKVAFIYDGTTERSGWVNDHEQGRRYVQQVLGESIVTSAYPDAIAGDLDSVIERAIGDGNKLIFTTSPRMLQASLRTAVEHPQVTVMNCSLNISHRYVRTYYPRMYEVKFILGVLAGSLTNSDRIGYVCDYPIFGRIAGINAFALGAQMANPRARVYLEWSSVKGAKEAALALHRRGIHIISSQDTARFIEDDRSSYGLSHVGEHTTDLLAVPVWKWGVYYEEIIKRMLDKTIETEYVNSKRALNYYWGMSAGVVDIEYASALPLPSRRFADFFRDSFIHNASTPFITPFYTQKGEKVGSGQKALTLEQIINMDYLADNVIGNIPIYDELTPIGQATVDTVGVPQAKSSADNSGGRS